MNDKERLEELIKTIKDLTGHTQEQISVAAGYKPKTLTQALSNKDGHGAVVRKLQIAYKDVLKISTHEDDFQAKYIALLEEQNKSNWNESLRILRELQAKLDGLPARLSPGSEKGIVVTGVYPKENKKGRQVP